MLQTGQSSASAEKEREAYCFQKAKIKLERKVGAIKRTVSDAKVTPQKKEALKEYVLQLLSSL